MRHRSLSIPGILVALSFAAASPAFAHHLPPGFDEVDEFADSASFLAGFHHPLTGLDHLVFALLTGFVASRFGRTGKTAMVAGAVPALLAGAFLARSQVWLPGGESILLTSVIVAFIVILTQSMGLLRAGAAALMAFNIWHGNFHAMTSLPAPVSGSWMAGVCSASVLVTVIGLLLAAPASRWMSEQVRKPQSA